MLAEQQAMFNHLQQEWAPFDVIQKLHGLDLQEELLCGPFRVWASRFRRVREVLRPDNSVNRHDLERYFQQQGLLPRKVAAVRLGMARASLENVLDELVNRGIFMINTLDFSEQIIDEKLVRRIHEHFPTMQHRVFESYSAYCKQLHEAIREDLQIDVEPLKCDTSLVLGEETIEYAHDYDCITGAPIGLRYQVWLDLGKPIQLRPDACSLKFYAENEAQLGPFVFAGRMPDIPEPLRVAE